MNLATTILEFVIPVKSNLIPYLKLIPFLYQIFFINQNFQSKLEGRKYDRCF